ncbi:hypothetical protein CQJ94_09905 [Glycomyces fuscus]|nr:hypothetical protein CQJ94_09905 [Glycomyces fuscus]
MAGAALLPAGFGVPEIFEQPERTLQFVPVHGRTLFRGSRPDVDGSGDGFESFFGPIQSAQVQRSVVQGSGEVGQVGVRAPFGECLVVVDGLGGGLECLLGVYRADRVLDGDPFHVAPGGSTSSRKSTAPDTEIEETTGGQCVRI